MPSSEERESLSTEAWGYLLDQQREGTLDAEQFERVLDLLEREASTLDGEPTIGSITVGCTLGWLDFRYGDDDWRKNRPQLARWYEKFSARPSLQATLPKA